MKEKEENTTNSPAVTQVCPNAATLGQSARPDSVFTANLERGFHLVTDQAVPDI